MNVTVETDVDGIPFSGTIVFLQINHGVFRPALVVATCCLEPMSESDLIVFFDGHYDDALLVPESGVEKEPGQLIGFAERRLAGSDIGFFQFERPPLKSRDGSRVA